MKVSSNVWVRSVTMGKMLLPIRTCLPTNVGTVKHACYKKNMFTDQVRHVLIILREKLLILLRLHARKKYFSLPL